MTELSQHAERRMNQRGVTHEFLDMIMEHADIDVARGDNCRIFRVHRKTARCLNLDDRLANYAVIWSDRSNQVVSVVPIHQTSVGASYRRVH